MLGIGRQGFNWFDVAAQFVPCPAGDCLRSTRGGNDNARLGADRVRLWPRI